MGLKNLFHTLNRKIANKPSRLSPNTIHNFSEKMSVGVAKFQCTINNLTRAYEPVAIDVDELKIGDHICRDRILYVHHGIYVGNGEVIHFAPRKFKVLHICVHAVALEKFMRGRNVYRVSTSGNGYSGNVIAERARQRLNDYEPFNLAFNNCEHFVRWCRFEACWDDV